MIEIKVKPATWKSMTRACERELLTYALWKSGGNVAHMSELLDVTRQTVYNLLERYNMSCAKYR